MFMQVQRLRAVFGTMWRCCGRAFMSVLIVAGLVASLAAGFGGAAMSVHHVEGTGIGATGQDHERGGQRRQEPPVAPDGPDTQVVIVGLDEGEDEPVITVWRRRRRPGSV